MRFLESGCTKNACGKACLDCYLNTLTEKDAQKIVEESCSSSFRLGIGIAKHQINPRLSQLELEMGTLWLKKMLLLVIYPFHKVKKQWKKMITRDKVSFLNQNVDIPVVTMPYLLVELNSC